jgi:hypothetical protein
VRYSLWVPKVFESLAEVGRDRPGVGLEAVGVALGFDGLSWEAFASQAEPGRALMSAMYDLSDLGLVTFENVTHGNSVTPQGRDVAERGFDSVSESLFGLGVSDPQRAFLARLYERARLEEADWADLTFVDAHDVYAEVGLATDDYTNIGRRLTFLGDLQRKALIRAESPVIDNAAYRPTYAAAVILTEDDPRFRGRRAGLMDWSVPTAGFESIEGRLADLKVALAAAITEDDLSDVGRRCREIPADAIDVVFRPEMVPSGTKAPSRQDAEDRLRLYLAARAPGDDYKEYRRFLRASLVLANARTHSARTGWAAAVAAAQGLLSFVRALQALERTAKAQGVTGNGIESSP